MSTGQPLNDSFYKVNNLYEGGRDNREEERTMLRLSRGGTEVRPRVSRGISGENRESHRSFDNFNEADLSTQQTFAATSPDHAKRIVARKVTTITTTLSEDPLPEQVHQNEVLHVHQEMIGRNGSIGPLLPIDPPFPSQLPLSGPGFQNPLNAQSRGYQNTISTIPYDVSNDRGKYGPLNTESSSQYTTIRTSPGREPLHRLSSPNSVLYPQIGEYENQPTRTSHTATFINKNVNITGVLPDSVPPQSILKNTQIGYGTNQVGQESTSTNTLININRAMYVQGQNQINQPNSSDPRYQDHSQGLQSHLPYSPGNDNTNNTNSSTTVNRTTILRSGEVRGNTIGQSHLPASQSVGIPRPSVSQRDNLTVDEAIKLLVGDESVQSPPIQNSEIHSTTHRTSQIQNSEQILKLRDPQYQLQSLSLEAREYLEKELRDKWEKEAITTTETTTSVQMQYPDNLRSDIERELRTQIESEVRTQTETHIRMQMNEEFQGTLARASQESNFKINEEVQRVTQTFQSQIQLLESDLNKERYRSAKLEGEINAARSYSV